MNTAQPNNAHLSAESVEFYTPAWIVDRARVVLGGVIDLDPCSCAEAQRVIAARQWLDKGDDGLDTPWPSYHKAIFVNPPGGTSRGARATMTAEQAATWSTTSTAVAWWRKLCRHVWAHGSAAIFVGFNLEIIRTAQPGSGHSWGPLNWTFLIPRDRIAFDRLVDGKRVPATSPTHGNVIVCLGPPPTRTLFAREFGGIGQVCNVG
jgi:hypothetical protein